MCFFCNFAKAGEILEKGSVLKQQSYVFSIEEAKALMLKIESLEAELSQQKELNVEYKNLENNLTLQNNNLNDLILIKDLQINEYKNIYQINLDRIKKLEKQSNFSKYEKWGTFSLGLGLAIGSILIADKIDDLSEQNSYNSNNKALLKF